MKKLLIASLCMTALTLTACDKKNSDATTSNHSNTTSAPASISLSKDNVADIKNDLTQLQTLSNAKSQEALKFQDEANKAAEQGKAPELTAVVNKMESFVVSFNKDLDALPIKSKEADSIRSKMKQSNDLGLELAKASIKTPPDMDKINALQKKAVDLQQELMTEMQTLEVKVNSKA
ncbi:hypothetical protein [Acinetobacter shaoyimingii]|uniref:Lipoprotein n=1 Tax=Acinetobacter shaoyimingii TaxID=2715164 RepID=A0A6G8RZ72_9GAMM|nr:hypothetical protein [Acinetobacter shaoyimingii]NHB59350.1 hypothetical protein [Acinetobacter shaoyimingii]QIO07197.1 hypothetical protein G8E00_15285 [Acinetobacter shaoyimingii]